MFNRILKTLPNKLKHFLGTLIPLLTGIYCIAENDDGVGIVFAVTMGLYFIHFLKLFLEDIGVFRPKI